MRIEKNKQTTAKSFQAFEACVPAPALLEPQRRTSVLLIGEPLGHGVKGAAGEEDAPAAAAPPSVSCSDLRVAALPTPAAAAADSALAAEEGVTRSGLLRQP